MVSLETEPSYAKFTGNSGYDGLERRVWGAVQRQTREPALALGHLGVPRVRYQKISRPGRYQEAVPARESFQIPLIGAARNQYRLETQFIERFFQFFMAIFHDYAPIGNR
jgi:hypothetical protein